MTNGIKTFYIITIILKTFPRKRTAAIFDMSRDCLKHGKPPVSRYLIMLHK